jgi:acyl carrier protein
MNMEDFIKNFALQFDETPAEQLKPETVIRDLDEWSSLIALSIIAMADEEYGVKISGEEIRNCITVNDIFEKIKSKKN